MLRWWYAATSLCFSVSLCFPLFLSVLCFSLSLSFLSLFLSLSSFSPSRSLLFSLFLSLLSLYSLYSLSTLFSLFSLFPLFSLAFSLSLSLSSLSLSLSLFLSVSFSLSLSLRPSLSLSCSTHKVERNHSSRTNPEGGPKLFWNPLTATYPTMCGPTDNTQDEITKGKGEIHPLKLNVASRTVDQLSNWNCTEGKENDLYLLHRYRLKPRIDMSAPRKTKNSAFARPREGKERGSKSERENARETASEGIRWKCRGAKGSVFFPLCRHR